MCSLETVGKSDANHVLKLNGKNMFMWGGKSRFRIPHRIILLINNYVPVLRILGTSYFLIDNQSGNGEDIDRFVM